MSLILVSPMTLEGCVSVSVVELAWGGSATNGATLSNLYGVTRAVKLFFVQPPIGGP